MTRTTAQNLDRVTLDQLSLRTFCSEPNTLEEYAREYPLETLCRTLQQLAAAVSVMLPSLPDSAFAAQPDDVDGSDVWSAGQVAGHLAAMEVASLPVWEVIFARRFDPPADTILDIVDIRLPDRRQAVAAAEAMERSIEILTTIALAVPAGDRTAAHFAIGTVGVAGALLGMCIHLADHIGQLEELAQDIPGDTSVIAVPH